jgi:hypothetical protein
MERKELGHWLMAQAHVQVLVLNNRPAGHVEIDWQTHWQLFGSLIFPASQAVVFAHLQLHVVWSTNCKGFEHVVAIHTHWQLLEFTTLPAGHEIVDGQPHWHVFGSLICKGIGQAAVFAHLQLHVVWSTNCKGFEHVVAIHTHWQLLEFTTLPAGHEIVDGQPHWHVFGSLICKGIGQAAVLAHLQLHVVWSTNCKGFEHVVAIHTHWQLLEFTTLPAGHEIVDGQPHWHVFGSLICKGIGQAAVLAHLQLHVVWSTNCKGFEHVVAIHTHWQLLEFTTLPAGHEIVDGQPHWHVFGSLICKGIGQAAVLAHLQLHVVWSTNCKGFEHVVAIHTHWQLLEFTTLPAEHEIVDGQPHWHVFGSLICKGIGQAAVLAHLQLHVVWSTNCKGFEHVVAIHTHWQLLEFTTLPAGHEIVDGQPHWHVFGSLICKGIGQAAVLAHLQLHVVWSTNCKGFGHEVKGHLQRQSFVSRIFTPEQVSVDGQPHWHVFGSLICKGIGQAAVFAHLQLHVVWSTNCKGFGHEVKGHLQRQSFVSRIFTPEQVSVDGHSHWHVFGSLTFPFGQTDVSWQTHLQFTVS